MVLLYGKILFDSMSTVHLLNTRNPNFYVTNITLWQLSRIPFVKRFLRSLIQTWIGKYCLKFSDEIKSVLVPPAAFNWCVRSGIFEFFYNYTLINVTAEWDLHKYDILFGRTYTGGGGLRWALASLSHMPNALERKLHLKNFGSKTRFQKLLSFSDNNTLGAWNIAIWTQIRSRFQIRFFKKKFRFIRFRENGRGSEKSESGRNST